MAAHAVLTCRAEVVRLSPLAQPLRLQVCAGETKLCLGTEGLNCGQFVLIEITLKTRVCVDPLH